MRISIGILAYNEEAKIAGTIRSLLAQSAFVDAVEAVETWSIIVVANGCTDRTAHVALEALQAVVPHVRTRSLEARVESLVERGKSNAWNEFVHRLAAPDTDIFVLVDSDIEFGHPDTVRNSIKTLRDNENARVVVDLPLKDTHRKSRRGLLERILTRMPTATAESDPAIAGSFYCARASALREIWMPLGLSVEDGFLHAMIVTDCFREPPAAGRVLRAQNASHYFEALTTVRALVRHEERLVIGTTLNCWLCWDTLSFVTPPDGPGAGHLIRALNESRPNWYRDMMTNLVANQGRRVVPRGVVARRFRGWSTESGVTRVRQLPFRALAVMFDVLVFWLADRKLRAGVGIGYW
jgi:glycosyltransferase involved in cell wall biosynthesis